MKTLSKEKFSEISRWIYENARELDIAYFEYHFKNGSFKKVRNELQKFQNTDGGFGNGLESDIRTTLSSSIATTVALQYISEFSLDENDKMIQIALSFFEKSFIEKEERWRAVPDETNLSPHASWWHIDEKSGMSAIDKYG